MTLKSFALLFLGFLLTEAKIPEYIHVCKANDPEISQCITNSINSLKPKLKSGIPELDVPSIDPLNLDTIKLRRGVQSNITDLVVYGVSDLKILEIKANIQKNRFMFKLRIPALQFNGNYELDMKIIFLSIKGNGPIYGNFTDYYLEGLMQGNKVIENGEEYLKFEPIKMRVNIGGAYLKLENLFNGDPILGDLTNTLINENVDVFLTEIKPTLVNALSEKFTDIANKITLTFTYKELFIN